MTDFFAGVSTAVPGFTGSPLDRADALRKDAAAMAAARSRADARWLVFDELRPVIADDGGLSWLPRDAIEDTAEATVFLGLDGDAPRFAVAGSAAGLGRVGDARTVAMALAAGPCPGEAAIVAQGRSLLDWHARHRFCANCGAPTRPVKAGYERACDGCGAAHFPRTDPVVIMLAVLDAAVDGEEVVLVGRQPGFAQAMFSALAGFVEPGESLEEAVARELFEEVGIRTGRVRYVASQPWPFPSNIMIGAFAEATTSTLVLDDDEIEAARWVTRAEVRAALDGRGEWRAPPPLAIAHTLLREWAG